MPTHHRQGALSLDPDWRHKGVRVPGAGPQVFLCSADGPAGRCRAELGRAGNWLDWQALYACIPAPKVSGPRLARWATCSPGAPDGQTSSCPGGGALGWPFLPRACAHLRTHACCCAPQPMHRLLEKSTFVLGEEAQTVLDHGAGGKAWAPQGRVSRSAGAGTIARGPRRQSP